MPLRPSIERADLTRFDLTCIDLTGFDAAALADSGAVRATRSALDLTARAAREVTYVTVGLTVLGFQRLQVRRRELERTLRR